jgi:hypothetical protein
MYVERDGVVVFFFFPDAKQAPHGDSYSKATGADGDENEDVDSRKTRTQMTTRKDERHEGEGAGKVNNGGGAVAPESADPSPSPSASASASPPMHFREYLWSEVLGGYFEEAEVTQQAASMAGLQYREDIYNFFAVPRELERLLTFGLVICLDTFLFYFTFFPIRVMIALLHAIRKQVAGWLSISTTTTLVPSEIFDVLRAVIWLVCFLVLQVTDASIMYHFIRGQAAIKLYVIFNVLEVCCLLLD